MKERGRILWISGVSAAIGGAFGAVSGSSSLLVVGIVGAAIAVFFAMAIRGIIR